MIYHFLLLSLFVHLFGNDKQTKHLELAGVYQGTQLFIQNSFRPASNDYCIQSIFINNRRQDVNYDVSAIVLSFENQDLYTPVAVRIVPKDTLCLPVIINPDAILFHTIYKFTSIQLSDSSLVWKTEGERESGKYIIEKLIDSFWVEQMQIEANGVFEAADYTFEPSMTEGSNKYRIKYEYGSNRYLYSQEVDYDFYPEPVTYSNQSSANKLILSRFSPFEIYNQDSELVLSGSDSEIDYSILPNGDFIIFFDGKDPGSFRISRR
ncbi:MAG: hypothetical protein ACI8QD_001400 [Cyclobacteriaceae bacterium]|jgi:hypothetical protein